MKKNCGLLLLIFLIAFASCQREKQQANNGRLVGFKPVYSNDIDLFTIQNKPPRAVVNAGKIYVKGNLIFQNEIGEGIHIINNSIPANAQRTGFIKIKGSQEISIKGDYLYSNNYADLVVVNISNLTAVTEVSRIRNAFSDNNSQLVPPVRGNYFECVDNSKGTVIGWVRDSIDNPKCKN